MKMFDSKSSVNLETSPMTRKLPTSREARTPVEEVKARMRGRTERHRRRSDLRRAAFSFNLFTRLPVRNYQREADQIWRDSWEQTGDHLRLAMVEWSIGRRDDTV